MKTKMRMIYIRKLIFLLIAVIIRVLSTRNSYF